MMEFDEAITKLQRDHNKLRKERNKRSSQTIRDQKLVDKRKREYLKQKAKLQLQKRKFDHIQQYYDKCEYSLGVVRLLIGSKSSTTMTSSTTNVSTTAGVGVGVGVGWQRGLELKATSIHGEGDKIALPPSILENLMARSDAMISNDDDADGTNGVIGGVGAGAGGSLSSPFTFRVGIINPNYKIFPTSLSMKQMMENAKISSNDEDNHHHTLVGGGGGGDDDERMKDNDDDGDDEDEDEMDETTMSKDAFLDEMSERYLSYTHCTVVEFTQDEGCIGLPRNIASSLLRGHKITTTPASASSSAAVDVAVHEEQDDGAKNGYVIKSTRTVDPSTTASAADVAAAAAADDDDNNNNNNMDVDMEGENDGNNESSSSSSFAINTRLEEYQPLPVTTTNDTDDDAKNTTTTNGEEKTPGHLAYGAFDIPSTPIEITLVNLPKGTGCTLQPTLSSIKNGFYNLKDIKIVLEQSLIRTRATLSLQDFVFCWHRGLQFELRVLSVTPNEFGSISCINTDIEVDIAPPPSSPPPPPSAAEKEKEEEKARMMKTTISSGYRLGGAVSGPNLAPCDRLNSLTTTTNGRTITNTTVTPPPPSASSSSSTNKNEQRQIMSIHSNGDLQLIPPEPPINPQNKEHLCTILIRGGDGVTSGKRRFDITTTKMTHLFQFASCLIDKQTTINGGGANENDKKEEEEDDHEAALAAGRRMKQYRLVTRFPRKSYEISNDTLKDVGIEGNDNQILFMLERI